MGNEKKRKGYSFFVCVLLNTQQSTDKLSSFFSI